MEPVANQGTTSKPDKKQKVHNFIQLTRSKLVRCGLVTRSDCMFTQVKGQLRFILLQLKASDFLSELVNEDEKLLFFSAAAGNSGVFSRLCPAECLHLCACVHMFNYQNKSVSTHDLKRDDRVFFCF